MAKHRAALGFENHHAAQHACRFVEVMDLDCALTTELFEAPHEHALGGDDSATVKVGGQLGEPVAFRENQFLEGGRVCSQCQAPVFGQDAHQGRLRRQLGDPLFVERENEAVDPVGDGRPEQLRFGWEEAIERLLRHRRGLSDAVHVRGGIAARDEGSARRLGDQMAGRLVRSNLRAPLGRRCAAMTSLINSP